MGPTVDFLTVEEVDRVLERVASLGLDWRESRFATYREQLIAQRKADRSFIDAFRTDEARRRLSFEAGAQLFPLLFAASVWDRLEQPLLKQSLDIVLGGQALDPPDDDRPRNTLLELMAAANLADRFRVALTASAEDVRLEHDVLGQGAVECKRPKMVDNILPNLSKIGSQLRAREKTGSRFGVAVIGGDRIARLASQAHEAPTIAIADESMEQMAMLIADRVLRDAWDLACDLSPTACYATVVVSGSVLVRDPLHIRPISQVLDFHLAKADVSGDVYAAFERRACGPLAGFAVDSAERPLSSQRKPLGGEWSSNAALELGVRITRPEGSQP